MNSEFAENMKGRKQKTRADIAIRRLLTCFLITTILLPAACNDSECMENKNSLPLAAFYSSTSVPQKISLDSLTIYGIGAPGDSILHDSVRTLSQTYLPFRIDQESTSYAIRYLSGLFGLYKIADTITFNYEIVPMFVSSACGVVYNYKITDIETTHYAIDSVTCPRGEITNINSENLRIYFRVAEEDEEE